MKEAVSPLLRIDNAFHAPLPRCVKVNAVDSGENINSDWLSSEADKVPRVRKIIRA